MTETPVNYFDTPEYKTEQFINLRAMDAYLVVQKTLNRINEQLGEGQTIHDMAKRVEHALALLAVDLEQGNRQLSTK